MVAQTRAAAIVMLTGYVEGYSEKCAEYLPRRPGQEQTYAGGVRVRCVAVQSMALEGGEDASDTAEPAGPAVATEVQLEVRLPADGAGGYIAVGRENGRLARLPISKALCAGGGLRLKRSARK